MSVLGDHLRFSIVYNAVSSKERSKGSDAGAKIGNG
jgi:hypothetical protein